MPETVVHFQIRLDPTLYARLADWAKAEGLSINALVVKTLDARATDHEKESAKESPKAPEVGPVAE